MKMRISSLIGVTALIVAPVLAFAQSQINTPGEGSVQSGSNVIEGYHCHADMASEIYGMIDGTTRVDMLFPFERRATESVCGHTNTGFMVQYFWARLEPGQHTLDMYIDGEQFDSVSFTTERLGDGFITPPQPGPVQVADFPAPGQTTWLCWSESLQDWGVCDVKTQEQDTNRSRTERLIGSWLMSYTIISQFTDSYNCPGPAEPNPNDPGGWWLQCTDTFGSRDVTAAWIVALEGYGILDTGSLIDKLYVFDLSGDTLSGCYYQITVSTGNMSRCYPLTGVRTASKMLSAVEEQDAEWDRYVEGDGAKSADKAAQAMLELLKQ